MLKIKLVIIFSFLIIGEVFAQNIKGTIYSGENRILYTRILNVSESTEVFSDENGYFELGANIKDSIVFKSSFYEEKTIIVNEKHLNNELVIDLKEKLNTLDEVIISNHKFNNKTYNFSLNKQLEYDIDKNMQAYEEPSNGNTDFVKIFKRLRKLAKKKEKKPNIKVEYADFYDLSLLFERSNFINNEPLKKTLKISENEVPLFIDFCVGKIEKKLLNPRNSFLLLDKLMILHLDYNKSRI